MKASELRIGNLVYCDMYNHNELVEINDIGNAWHTHKPFDKYRNVSSKIRVKEYKGIPLTKYWFERFGIIQTSNTNYQMGSYTIVMSGNCEYWRVMVCGRGIAKLIHVHQLQNLYYALCGEELDNVE